MNMEDNKNEVGHQDGWHKHVDGSMCGYCGHGHRHFLLRWLLGLFILIVVFWLGVKVGELKGAFGSDYGYRGMMRGYPTTMYGNQLQYYPGAYSLPPMMRATTTPQQ